MDPSSRAHTAVARSAVLVAGALALTAGAGLAALHHATGHHGGNDGHGCALCLHHHGNPAACPPAAVLPMPGVGERMARDSGAATTTTAATSHRSRAPPSPVSVP